MADPRVILTIDDEHDITEMIGMMLQAEGFRVVEANSVFDGMKALADDTPSVILLDLMMPGVDGMQFCRTLTGNPATRDIPVIFVTALGGEADRDAALAAGAAGYLSKPFSTEQLMGEIARVIGD